MKVELTYFKASGKYYSSGSYETKEDGMYEIFREVKVMQKNGCLPDLVKGCTEFHIHINVPEHRHNHPHLILGIPED